jgi:hypothetical protein
MVKPLLPRSGNMNGSHAPLQAQKAEYVSVAMKYFGITKKRRCRMESVTSLGSFLSCGVHPA